MATTSGRVLCPKCGSNNFETQAACWKCGTPLQGGTAPSLRGPVSSSPPSVAPSVTPPPSVAPVPILVAPQSSVDPSVAIWAGVALAIFFPYLAIPVGIVFMMLDDRRKLDVGRITLIWGIVSFVVQTLFTLWLASAAIQTSMSLVTGILKARASSSGEGLSTTDEPAVSFPGLPQSDRPRPRFSVPSVPSLPNYPNVPLPEVPPEVRR